MAVTHTHDMKPAWVSRQVRSRRANSYIFYATPHLRDCRAITKHASLGSAGLGGAFADFGDRLLSMFAFTAAPLWIARSARRRDADEALDRVAAGFLAATAEVASKDSAQAQ